MYDGGSRIDDFTGSSTRGPCVSMGMLFFWLSSLRFNYSLKYPSWVCFCLSSRLRPLISGSFPPAAQLLMPLSFRDRISTNTALLAFTVEAITQLRRKETHTLSCSNVDFSGCFSSASVFWVCVSVLYVPRRGDYDGGREEKGAPQAVKALRSALMPWSSGYIYWYLMMNYPDRYERHELADLNARRS